MTVRGGRDVVPRARTGAIVVVALLVGTAACSPGPSRSPGSALTVVTTTTVFADMVRQVAGDAVTVESLVPANGDVHTFSPSPSAARLLSQAGLVVMNGLGLDDWLESTVSDIGTAASVLKLGADLPAEDYIAGDAGAPVNPHLWLDVTLAATYANRIVDALARVDPDRATAYRANGQAYVARLRTLDGWVRDQVATIPEANRRFVSFHDAFPYFARRYGLQIVGVAVQAPGQDPSAAETAQLVDAIRRAGVKAIFSEAQFPPRLVDQLAAETGASVVANLYDDSLGDPPVTTYEALIRWDVTQVVEALS
ncbi:MAG TPA: metal ABC transporter substrate-binding protein [Candidatus Limnocylindrales bacterium]|nr:metal ABC transporter substrate-binding protein [Candidatus Limnocylindrales bacterium]